MGLEYFSFWLEKLLHADKMLYNGVKYPENEIKALIILIKRVILK